MGCDGAYCLRHVCCSLARRTEVDDASHASRSWLARLMFESLSSETLLPTCDLYHIQPYFFGTALKFTCGAEQAPITVNIKRVAARSESVARNGAVIAGGARSARARTPLRSFRRRWQR